MIFLFVLQFHDGKRSYWKLFKTARKKLHLVNKSAKQKMH